MRPLSSAAGIQEALTERQLAPAALNAAFGADNSRSCDQDRSALVGPQETLSVINVPVNLLPAEQAYFDGEMYGVCPAAS